MYISASSGNPNKNFFAVFILVKLLFYVFSFGWFYGFYRYGFVHAFDLNGHIVLFLRLILFLFFVLVFLIFNTVFFFKFVISFIGFLSHFLRIYVCWCFYKYYLSYWLVCFMYFYLSKNFENFWIFSDLLILLLKFL